MRKTIATLVLAGSLFGLAAQAQDEPNPLQVIKQLESPSLETRRQALDQMLGLVYSLEDQKLRSRIRGLLFDWLEKEEDPEVQTSIARALESMLSHDGTPTADFLRAQPYLLHANSDLRHTFWLAFYQQASQPSLTEEIDAQLLALTSHSDKAIQLEAMNWAIEAPRSRNLQAGSPLTPLGVKAQKLFLATLKSPDPELRNNAVYGLLAQYGNDPKPALQAAQDHLDDPHGDTRSLIIDFIEQKARHDAEMVKLGPALFQRFRSGQAEGDFPQQVTAELGWNEPPMPEQFRLARVLSLLGPLPDDVWSYLLERPPARWLRNTSCRSPHCKAQREPPCCSASCRTRAQQNGHYGLRRSFPWVCRSSASLRCWDC